VPGKSNKLHAIKSNRPQAPDRGPPVDISTAAEILGVSHKTIRRRIADRTLPAYRVGGKSIRVYLDDVEALNVCV
jgi:excisionase family DNA binding protein